ncbi:hypothetical protein BDV93DRAFT_563475 [Ceratobasidium sp. AG-I]|nr:hypothetical protein BDV93DRAFT_563475 [Ceratobasidium sp. AG-I]
MLTALASCTVATNLPTQVPLQQCPGLTSAVPHAICNRDMNRPVNFQYHCPPLPAASPSVEPSNVRIYGRVAPVMFITIFCVYHVVHVFLRWSSNYNSTVASARSIPHGRRTAVAGVSQPRVESQTEQRARSFNQTDVNDRTEPLPPTEPPPLEDPGLKNVESNFAPEGQPSTASVPRQHGRCTLHPQCRTLLSTKASMIWRDVPILNHYPSIHQVTARISSSGNVEPIDYPGDEVHPSPQSSTSQTGSYKRTSLIKSLNGPPIAYEIIAFSILVIALNWSHDSASLHGVTHDIRWFKRMCSSLESFMTLRMLTEATHDTIRSKILEMHKDARPGTAVVMYLDGHGDGDWFLLYDGTRVNAVTLVMWIGDVRRETNQHLPVYIVFDHCRYDAPAPPSVNLGQDIHILYACMHGQRSADIKMTGDNDAYIPCSNFLKVLTLVVDEARTSFASFADCLMSRMNFWMEVMARMTRAEECRKKKCPKPCSLCSCPGPDSCTHPDTRSKHRNPFAYPRVQNPNGLFGGVQDCLCTSELLERLEPTAAPLLDRLQETAKLIKNQEAYIAVNKGLVPVDESNLFQPSGSRPGRGKSAGTAAAPTRSLPT